MAGREDSQIIITSSEISRLNSLRAQKDSQTSFKKILKKLVPGRVEVVTHWGSMVDHDLGYLCWDSNQGWFVSPFFVPFLAVPLALFHGPRVALQIRRNIAECCKESKHLNLHFTSKAFEHVSTSVYAHLFLYHQIHCPFWRAIV